jgi:restriction endonuclease Mrr
VRFMLPIPDPQRMLSWLRAAPWDELQDFVKNAGARGHSRRTIGKLTRIVERRRWREEYRVRRDELPENLPSVQERIWRRSERRELRRSAIEEIRALSPVEFEQRTAQAFASLGYDAVAVGKAHDNGVDVEIRDAEGRLWGVAQCKRYSEGTAITGRDIRAFGGAFLMSGAQKGFYVTSGRLTRAAKRTAAQFSWLTVLSKHQAVSFINGDKGLAALG